MKIKREPTNAYPSEALTSPITVNRHDPYFLWALENDGVNVGGAGTRVQRTKSGQLVKTEYFQVLIELWNDTMSSENKAKRIKAFRAFAGNGAYGFRARAADDFDIDRFICGIVNQDGFLSFLKDIDKVCVRYEMAHPMGPESTAPIYVAAAQPSSAFRAVKAEWQHADKALDGDVMVIIDYGCPFAHAAFRDENKSRIRYVWFQGTAPVTQYRMLPKACRIGSNDDLFAHGYELRGSMIDSLLLKHGSDGVVNEAAIYEEIGYELMSSASTHGGHVMDIACGSPNPLYQNENDRWLSGQRIGHASIAKEFDEAGKAQIIFVQLPYAAVGDSSGGGMNVFLVDALKYVLERTKESANIVVNCSFGTNAGPHDGTSMLERAIDFYAARREGHLQVVIPAGNSFNSGCHAMGEISKDNPVELIVDVTAEKPSDTFIEVWYTGDGGVKVEIAPPGSDYMTDAVSLGEMASWGEHSHFNPVCTVVHTKDATPAKSKIPGSHMALIAIAPTRPYDKTDLSKTLSEAAYGHWKIRLSTSASEKTKTTIDAWIERDDPIFQAPSDRQSRFVTDPQVDDQDEYATGPATKFNTLNSYATGDVITAGAMVGPNARTADLTDAGVRPFVSSYASAGPVPPQRRHGDKPVPNFIAYAEDSEVLLGRNAAGSSSRSAVRRNGSSVSSPQVARALMNKRGTHYDINLVEPSSKDFQGDERIGVGALLQSVRAGGGALVS